MRPSIVVSCLLVGASVAMWIRPASACSCASISSSPDVESVDAGFVGTVMEVDVPVLLRESVVEILPGSTLGPVYRIAAPTVQVRFEVERWYTYPRGRSVVIDTGSGLCCDCSLGASFVVGGRYLVGAYQSEGALLASSCNRPAYEGDDPERFAALLDRLGPGRAPLEATGERSHLGPTALGLLSALGLLAVGLLLLRLRAAFAVEASAPLPWRRARERVSAAVGRRRRPTDRCR